MAGVAGIEPASAVLETAVLPLYDTPNLLINDNTIHLLNSRKML